MSKCDEQKKIIISLVSHYVHYSKFSRTGRSCMHICTRSPKIIWRKNRALLVISTYASSWRRHPAQWNIWDSRTATARLSNQSFNLWLWYFVKSNKIENLQHTMICVHKFSGIIPMLPLLFITNLAFRYASTYSF